VVSGSSPDQSSVVFYLAAMCNIFRNRWPSYLIEVLVKSFSSASSEPSHPVLCARPCFMKHKVLN
jgi:hypothetical protein